MRGGEEEAAGAGSEARSAGLHVIFGSGQVGSHLAESLLRDGTPVRVVKRSPGGVPEGAEAVFGDATDVDVCRAAASGARVVYHCMNPAYRTAVWREVLPQHLGNLVAAAGSAGARLVVLENLYMLGVGDGTPLTEETPMDPRSRKGEIRARLAQELLEAHERGDVQAVSGRASDFYGPRGVGTHFADRFWTPALQGKPAEFIPDPDTPHTYHYIPDVAEGLKALGAGPEEILGRPWMLPCAPAEPTRALVRRFSAALGREIGIRGMPRPLLAALGVFVPIVREVKEMLHQWEVPFVVDDARFRARFALRPTDPDDAAARTVAWARRAYGGAS